MIKRSFVFVALLLAPAFACAQVQQVLSIQPGVTSRLNGVPSLWGHVEASQHLLGALYLTAGAGTSDRTLMNERVLNSQEWAEISTWDLSLGLTLAIADSSTWYPVLKAGISHSFTRSLREQAMYGSLRPDIPSEFNLIYWGGGARYTLASGNSVGLDVVLHSAVKDTYPYNLLEMMVVAASYDFRFN